MSDTTFIIDRAESDGTRVEIARVVFSGNMSLRVSDVSASDGISRTICRLKESTPQLQDARASTSRRERHSREMRERIRTRLKALHSEGHSIAEIARTLSKEGFTRPCGMPMNGAFVRSALVAMGCLTASPKSTYAHRRSVAKATMTPETHAEPGFLRLNFEGRFEIAETMKNEEWAYELKSGDEIEVLNGETWVQTEVRYVDGEFVSSNKAIELKEGLRARRVMATVHRKLMRRHEKLGS